MYISYFRYNVFVFIFRLLCLRLFDFRRIKVSVEKRVEIDQLASKAQRRKKQKCLGSNYAAGFSLHRSLKRSEVLLSCTTCRVMQVSCES